jgi:hypothetical protein
MATQSVIEFMRGRTPSITPAPSGVLEQTRERAARTPEATGYQEGSGVEPMKPDPLQRMLDYVAREGPKIVGAATGAAIGAPFGPAGVIVGASAGAATGEGARQIFEQLRTGDPNQSDPGRIGEAFVEGPIQEGGGAVTAWMARKAAGGLDKLAAGQVRRVLNPTKERNKATTQQIEGRLSRETPWGAVTQGGLNRSYQARAETATRKLEEAWDAIPEGDMFDTQMIIDAVNKAKSEFIVTSSLPPGVQGPKVQVDVVPKAVKQLNETIAILEQFGSQMSAGALRKTRQVWDKLIAKAGGFAGKDLGSSTELYAEKQATDAIRAAIGQKYPDVKALNADVSFWLKANEVLTATIDRETGRSLSMTDLVSGATGVTAAQQGKGYAWLALPVVIRAMQSTAWRTTSARAKTELSMLLKLKDGRLPRSWQEGLPVVRPFNRAAK